MVFQNFIGNIVSVVGDHNARTDAEGIGAVVPLFPLRGNLILTAAENQRDLVQLKVVGQRVRQVHVQKPGGEFPALATGELKNLQSG